MGNPSQTSAMGMTNQSAAAALGLAAGNGGVAGGNMNGMNYASMSSQAFQRLLLQRQQQSQQQQQQQQQQDHQQQQ